MIQSPLIGSFNISNVLAVVAALTALDWGFEDICDAIAAAHSIPGRMELIKASNASRAELPTVVVDYAHTPDALAHSLSALRALNPRQLICVFGCGGDRDQDKRPVMGRIAEDLADQVVITSDNPRTESPKSIADAIIAGQQKQLSAVIELSREKAIATAIEQAAAEDIVLVAGKGHEDYQVVGDKRTIFSDQAVCRKFLEARAAGFNS